MVKAVTQVWLISLVSGLLAAATPAGFGVREPGWTTMCTEHGCKLWNKVPYHGVGEVRLYLISFSVFFERGSISNSVVFNHPAFASVRWGQHAAEYITIRVDPNPEVISTYTRDDLTTQLKLRRSSASGRTETPTDFLMKVVAAQRLIVNVDGHEITVDLPGVGKPLIRMILAASERLVGPAVRHGP